MRWEKTSVTVSAAASAMIWLARPSSPSIAAVSTVMFTALSTIRSVGSTTVMSTTSGACDGELVQIRVQVERVMGRRHRLRQPAGRRGEGEKFGSGMTAARGDHRYDERAEDQRRGAFKQ